MFSDGTTEPIIAIIGHPIAGNPSQLAIERSLQSLGLEWRVLSFDVAPDNVAKALDGFAVTGIAGVMVAKNLQNAAADWYSQYAQPLSRPESGGSEPGHAKPGHPAPGTQKNEASETEIDAPVGDEQPQAGAKNQTLVSSINCLHRSEELDFLGSDQQIAYLENRLADRSISDALWLGELPDEDQRRCWPSQWNLFSGKVRSTDLDAEQISAADLIVLADFDESDAGDGELEEWPVDDGTTFVIDLVGREAFAAELKVRGYIVIGCVDLQVGMLAGCIEKWTGKPAPRETIAESIEEYFGV